MSTAKDEIWTMRDGTKIAVGDMDETHVRNALRMVLRQQRRKRSRQLGEALDVMEMTVGECQDMLDAEARNHDGMVFNPEGGYWTTDTMRRTRN